jgi:ketosteroid isomerase-like protein
MLLPIFFRGSSPFGVIYLIMNKLLLSFLFVLLSFTMALAQSEKQKTAIRAEITRVMTDQAIAWNNGDVDGFMKGYWKSEKLVFVSAEVTRGWQPTLDRYKKSYSSRALMGTLSFSDLEIDVFSKDSAAVLGSWSLARDKDNPHGKFTLIFKRFKDGWKIVHDHTS